MIIEAREDVVYVSGPLLANNWAAIKTTAGLVKQAYPMGVILDFADVSVVSRLGEITFVEALFDIEREALPFVLDNVPDALAGRLEALLEEYHDERSPETENASGRDARRIHQAIFSETWWHRLWGPPS